MKNTFVALENYLAQIEAADDLAVALSDMISDWADTHDSDPPIDDVAGPLDLLDTLACLGLRFETICEERSRSLDRILDRWADELYADLISNWHMPSEVDENDLRICLEKTDLVIVPDEKGICSKAYMTLLQGGKRHLQPEDVSKSETP